MLRFGKVVPGSDQRGYIKGTDIANGAGYLDILNCESVLLLRTSLGCFEVRLFADNNRTPCFHCKLTGHPSYQYKDRSKILNERRFNDISKHKDDSDQINLLVTKAVFQVKSAYPESHVGLFSIIPRNGNSAQINRLNQSATNVKKFIRKLCARENNVDFVDLEKLLYRNGTIITSMFDKADNSGVHISTEDAQNINRKLNDFFLSPKPCVQELHTPTDPKRKRSDGAATPTSADRMSKRSNTAPKMA
ncbi:unnamed protein product [Mytilus coruscus]|uniref:Uncharacterized protein n=1 Tax=Mytilus coruscus TaxID=42192 RepID=A0A6J8EZV2_MYTCO|nr:unnamed protein product [Mytilus coruscus]